MGDETMKEATENQLLAYLLLSVSLATESSTFQHDERLHIFQLERWRSRFVGPLLLSRTHWEAFVFTLQKYASQIASEMWFERSDRKASSIRRIGPCTSRCLLEAWRMRDWHLTFLFSADTSGTRSGLLLLYCSAHPPPGLTCPETLFCSPWL